MATLSIRNITSISFEWQVTGMESIDIKSSVALSSNYYGTGVSSIPATSIFSSVLMDNYQTSIDWTTYTSGQSYFSWNPGETFTVYAYRYTSAYYYIGSYTINTPSYNPTTPSAPVSATRIDGGFNLSWGSSSGADYYVLSYWTLNDAKDTIDSIQQINVYGTSKTLTGLVYGDTYHFAVMAANDAGYSNWTAETMAAVAPKIPTLSSSNITSTSVRITASGMTGKWAYIEVYQYNSGGTYMATGYIFYSQANYIDFTNLTAGSTYTFKAKAFVQSDSGGYVESLTYSSSISVTASSYQRPTNWSWTTAELNAFNNNGTVTTLTYTRWNSFIDKVQEFINYYNTKYGTGVPSVTQYKMSSSNKTLTATAFNNIRFSIGSMNPTGISNVSTGDTVYGSYFTTLSNKLNGIS